jgi:glycosyltransferase involved in cell wall biosynthesis
MAERGRSAQGDIQGVRKLMSTTNSVEPDSVAVVIPHFCNGTLLDEAVASVLSQTRLPNEVVVVDDSSPRDNEGLERLPAGVDLIRLDLNQGPGAARQVGVDSTRSKWVAFLDADDVWMPTKLERQLEELGAHPEWCANHCALTTVRADGSRVSHLNKPFELDLATQLRRNQALPSSLMVERKVLLSLGGWCQSRTIGEDWDLGIRLVEAGHKIGFLAESLVLFRRLDHGNRSARGLEHMMLNLRTIRHHRNLYLKELKLGGTLGVAGRIVHDEGCRRGGIDGFGFRAFGRLLMMGQNSSEKFS